MMGCRKNLADTNLVNKSQLVKPIVAILSDKAFNIEKNLKKQLLRLKIIPDEDFHMWGDKIY